MSEPKAHPAKSGAKSFRKAHPDAARVLAYDVLTDVNRGQGYSNLALPRALTESSLEPRDKAFATELLYGTLRMQGRHDWILSQVSDRPWESVDSGIIDVARLGAHQLFEMRTPVHAAVSATVELARKVLGDSKAAYVNALLRRSAEKTLDEWLLPLDSFEDPIESLSIRYSHPEWIVSSYFDLLRDRSEVELALGANNIPAPPTLVSWPGRSTQDDLVALGGLPSAYSSYGATSVSVPGEIDLVRNRRAGVQDEGSQLVASVFASAAINRDRWLDLCAGPGGKAALLSSIAKEQGKNFTANEISEARANLIAQVVVDTHVWVGDGRKIADRLEMFDAVIADVPCTGIGALRRRPEIRWRRKPSDLAGLNLLQAELFDSAISVTQVGGLVAYATCSPHMAETKIQVLDALKRHPEIRQIPIDPYLPIALTHAVSNGNMQLWTHRHGTDAMFLALFERIA